jgi:hypothetical protein
MPVIPATQEAEIRKIVVQSQPGQIVQETLIQKTLHKKRAGGVTQGVGSEFKSQYCKKVFFSRNVGDTLTLKCFSFFFFGGEGSTGT